MKLGDEEDEEAEDERRDRGRAGRGGVCARSALTVRDDGRVRERSEGRLGVFLRTKMPEDCFVSVPEPSEAES